MCLSPGELGKPLSTQSETFVGGLVLLFSWLLEIPKTPHRESKKLKMIPYGTFPTRTNSLLSLGVMFRVRVTIRVRIKFRVKVRGNMILNGN